MNASTSPSVSWEFTWYQGLDTQVLCTIQGEGSDSFCSSPFTHQRVMELISLQLSNWLLVIVRLPSSEKPLTMQQEKRLPTHPDSLPSSPVTTTGKKDFPLLTSRYLFQEGMYMGHVLTPKPSTWPKGSLSMCVQAMWCGGRYQA